MKSSRRTSIHKNEDSRVTFMYPFEMFLSFFNTSVRDSNPPPKSGAAPVNTAKPAKWTLPHGYTPRMMEQIRLEVRATYIEPLQPVHPDRVIAEGVISQERARNATDLDREAREAHRKHWNARYPSDSPYRWENNPATVVVFTRRIQ